MGLDPYPDPDQREHELVELVRAWPRPSRPIELIRYGESVEGRPLHAVRIPSPAGSTSPRVLVSANIHGPEYISNRVCTTMLEQLVHGQASPELSDLHARAELWLAPCLNPDGYARTFACDGVGPLPHLRHNAHGVDLNRNWPLPPGGRRLPLPAAGSDRPGDPTYRGTAPLSEPETAALERVLDEQRFHAGVNLHSFMGTLFPARVRERDSFSRYRELCRTFVRAQREVHYHRLASRIFDTYTGELEDHQHHNHACWSICVETFSVSASYRQHLRAPSLFWRFNPRDPARWARNDVPAIAAFLLAALALPPPTSSSK